MRYTLLFAFLSICNISFGQYTISLGRWNEEAQSNQAMQPKYGGQPRTSEKRASDEKFIREIMALPEYADGNKKAASDHMINLGFNYLYRGDLKTAMYRFNQAYLLDSTNTDIYWGYGAVYMALEDWKNAKKQYNEGLVIDPHSTHLLTDYGTYFMGQYYILAESPVQLNGEVYLDSCISYLSQSYALDPKDVNTVYKLSVSYLAKGDCDNAWKYFDECKSLGGTPITPEFTKDLKERCKRKK